MLINVYILRVFEPETERRAMSFCDLSRVKPEIREHQRGLRAIHTFSGRKSFDFRILPLSPLSTNLFPNSLRGLRGICTEYEGTFRTTKERQTCSYGSDRWRDRERASGPVRRNNFAKPRDTCSRDERYAVAL